MKNILFILSSFAIMACSANPPKRQAELPEKVQSEWTEKHTQSFEGVKEYASQNTTLTRSDATPVLAVHRFASDPDSFTVFPMPGYELDEDKFMENPTSGNIIESLRVPDDKTFFFGYDPEGSFFLETTKMDGKWYPRSYVLDCGAVIEWLQKELPDSDSDDYMILSFYGRYYFILFYEGRPVYYNFNGKIQKSAELADFFKALITNIRDVEAGRSVPMYF